MSISTTRRFLHPSTAATPPAAAQPPQPRPGFGSFDMNVVMVLSVLLCALVCSLGLNAILKCALRCTTLISNRDGGTLVSNPKGVRRNVLMNFPTLKYSKEANKLRGIDGECVICLAEFESGDAVRVLPNCCHGFHVHCIDKWLSSHSSCPKCRNCLTDTHRKVHAGCGSAAEVAAAASTSTAAVDVVIAPVEREGLMWPVA